MKIIFNKQFEIKVENANPNLMAYISDKIDDVIQDFIYQSLGIQGTESFSFGDKDVNWYILKEKDEIS